MQDMDAPRASDELYFHMAPVGVPKMALNAPPVQLADVATDTEAPAPAVAAPAALVP